jgi:hypothetical protein
MAGGAAERGRGIRDGDPVCQDRRGQLGRHDVQIPVVHQHVRREPVAVTIGVAVEPKPAGDAVRKLVGREVVRRGQKRAELTAGQHHPGVGPAQAGPDAGTANVGPSPGAHFDPGADEVERVNPGEQVARDRSRD